MKDIQYLVLSSTIDYSSDLICAEFEKRGVHYLRLNRDHFSDYQISYNVEDDTVEVKMDGTWFRLVAAKIKAVYFRAPVFLRLTGKSHTVEEQLMLNQWSSFLRNLIIFEKALWVNHPALIYRAENKAFQLKVAKQCGLDIPKTFIGNVLPHSIDLNCTYIVKALDTALFYENGNEMFTYSTMIGGQELLDAEIKTAPIILQDYLHNKIDLRVTVIGSRVFPVTITKNGQPLQGDWREKNKDNLEYTPVELPQIINEKLIRLMKKLELSFGGVDLAFSDGKYYFIEINPTGEWGWLKTCTGIPIDNAIVDYLIAGRENEYY